MTEEDRAELAARVVPDLNQMPPSDQIFEHLPTLLVRRAQLKGLEDQLSHELDRRVPETADNDLSERVVNLADLLPSLPLTSPEELEAWLERIRVASLTALGEQKPARRGKAHHRPPKSTRSVLTGPADAPERRPERAFLQTWDWGE